MTFLLANWRLVLLGVLLAVIGVQTWRLDRSQKETVAVQAAFAAFKATTAAIGERARADALIKESADKERKAKADAENIRATASLRADVERMRRERDSSRRSSLPASPTGSRCPDGQACFDRAILDAALRDYLAEARKLADQCGEIEVDLNTAKRWAGN